MASIKLRSVEKSYGDIQVIPPMDLDIEDGEFVVLVGPSGCGKSTTLRMIAGLETTSSGEISIGERDVTSLRPGLRDCSMVFQTYALYPHMTVKENIGYGMKVRGVDKKTVAEAVTNAAKTLNLTDYLGRKPAALSGGQRQRVAIGRAIVRDPKVFLFDEPLSNLDAKLRVEMRVEIKQLHRRLKTTMVYVTHDQVEAMTMADRVVVLKDGIIEQAADPITLYERPINQFVASFIGAPSMNMIEGTLIDKNGDVSFEMNSGLNIAIPADRQSTLTEYVGEKFILGIRPEHTSESPDLGPKIEMNVIDIEPLGPHTLLVGDVDGGKFTTQFASATTIKPDEQADVYLNTEKMHLFRSIDGTAVR